MNLEHRLQHAARELREVTIEVPPLGSPTTMTARRPRPRLVPALAAPILFAAGALFAVGAVRSVEQPVHSDIGVVGTVVEPIAEPAEIRASTSDAGFAVAPGVTAPSIHEELEMISEFLADSQFEPPVIAENDPPVDDLVPGPADDVGPI